MNGSEGLWSVETGVIGMREDELFALAERIAHSGDGTELTTVLKLPNGECLLVVRRPDGSHLALGDPGDWDTMLEAGAALSHQRTSAQTDEPAIVERELIASGPTEARGRFRIGKPLYVAAVVIASFAIELLVILGAHGAP